MKAYGKSWGYNVYDCRYCLYRNGSLEKTIQPDAGQQIIPGAHFYASVSGNYVDIFNYRDELCARFLLGSSRLD